MSLAIIHLIIFILSNGFHHVNNGILGTNKRTKSLFKTPVIYMTSGIRYEIQNDMTCTKRCIESKE